MIKKIIRVCFIFAVIISSEIFFNNINMAKAGMLYCVRESHGFCSALGLEAGKSMEIDLDKARKLLNDYRDANNLNHGNSNFHSNDNMNIKSTPHDNQNDVSSDDVISVDASMDKTWFWACYNGLVVMQATCDKDNWGEYGGCDSQCGKGMKYRYNECGDKEGQSCNTGSCCGKANNKTYKSVSELLKDKLCINSNSGNEIEIENNLVTNQNTGAWKWKCGDDNCQAFKFGECGELPYSSYETGACKAGSFNSVHLDDEGILKWKCGTGNSNKKIGTFGNKDNKEIEVSADYYSPVDCQCIPDYSYECKYEHLCGERNCGRSVINKAILIKKDNKCFPNQTLVITSETEKEKQKCINKTYKCSNCTSQQGNGTNSTGDGWGVFETKLIQ